MKYNIFLSIIGMGIILSVSSCNETPQHEDNMTDTTMTTLPAAAPSDGSMEKKDTAAVPRIDPSLDSAAKEKDEDLPAK